MKKRILALLLTLALVLPAVSCDVLLADPNGSATPSDSQSESNSNNTPDTERVPSKGPEVHTQPETPPDSEPPVEWPDEPQDSEQIDPPVDPEPETEPETEEPLPYVEKEAAGMKGHSIDTFFANGEMYFEQDGMAGDKLTAQENKVVFKTGETAQSIALRGWIGFDQAIASFGYYVDGYDFVWGEFAQATEDGVLAAGGEFASRFHIIVPLTGLTSGTEHKIGFILKLADGTVVRLREEVLVTIENNEWTNREVVVHQSFDELFYGEGRTGIFTPGHSATWDFVATFDDTSVEALNYWGWIAYMGKLGQFGYQINYGEAIYDDAWAWETGDDVVNAAKSTGADSGSRMNIVISLAGLRGENNVRVLYKADDGTVVLLNEFTVVIPTHYADYNVPQDQWAISGHRPQLQNSSDGMVAAAGVEYAALLHQGSIYLGEIDLSKYSKVVIYWGSDNSQVTMDRYNENAHNRIMLLSADMNMMNSPTEDTIIAGSTYTLHGWAVQAHEIDLTGIDYNGPVYVTWDTLPGTFMLISSVEFIGGEIVDAEPEAPVEPFVVPEHTDKAIDLATGHGAPFSGAPNYSFGQKFDIGENFLKQVTIKDMATYGDGGVNTWTFKVYKWKGNYSKTVAAGPIFSASGENHADNTSFVIDIPAELGIRGEFYYEITYTSGSGCFTGWTADSVAAGVETYVAGNRMDSSYTSSIVVGVPATEAPTAENYNVPMESWTVSGHAAGLTHKDKEGHGPMVAAGGLEYGALLHQGAVGVGEIDLSKYSKVIIKYGIDNSQVTLDHHAANGTNRIMLSMTDSSMVNAPAETDVIAAADYFPQGWMVVEIEIDLTGIDYNGPVYVTWDTLPGTFMLIGSVEFIGGEIR